MSFTIKCECCGVKQDLKISESGHLKVTNIEIGCDHNMAIRITCLVCDEEIEEDVS